MGIKNVRACTACGQCAKNKNEACVIKTDDVNAWIQKMKEADGILLGSQVHYASLAAVRRSGGLPTFNN